MNSPKKGTPLPRLSSRKRSLTNPDVIQDFASKQVSGAPYRMQSNPVFTEKEKQKAALGKKGTLAVSGGITNGNGTSNGTSNGPVIGGGISLGTRSPTLGAVSKATLIATHKKSTSPSPTLKPPRKLIKSTNGGSSSALIAAPNNESRLSALYRYDIMDTPPEISFDDIAKMASVSCGTPIAVITLVDKDRQWIKARVGVEPNQNPVDMTFSSHTIADTSIVFEVKDATKDERFSSNTLVTEGPINLRFYAGAPLVTADNKALGALCVIDRKARALTPAQSETLRALARLTVNQLELRSRTMQLQEAQTQNQTLHKELEAKNEALVARNTHLETQIKELELNKASDISLNAPAESVISVLRRLQTQLGEKHSSTLEHVIGVIGSNRIYEVDVKDAIQKAGRDLDDQTKGFLITQLHDANPAKENNPSRPSSAAPTLSARHTTIEPYRHVLEGFEKWDYDIFHLSSSTGGRPLTCAGFRVLEQHELLEKLDFPAGKVLKYLQAVEAGYNTNPYHNNIHATDVLLGTNYLICSSGIYKHMSNNEIFAALFAALIHDLGHPGFNNAFLISTGHDLAVTHNDRSVLENHHCAQAFKLLQLPENNFMEKLPLADRQEIRKTVIELVLATDMSQHVEIFNQFQNKRKTEGIDIMGSKPDRLLALKMVIKCADISNPARDPVLYKQWVDCIMEEFWRQGDAEKHLGMPISAFMDRSTPNVPKCQSGFIQFIAMPTYTAFVEQFPGSQNTLDLMKNNLAYYKSLLEPS